MLDNAATGKGTLSHNVMLQLYAQHGKLEKVDTLLQEIEEKGSECHKISFHTPLNAYASASDIEGMLKLLTEMVANPGTKWSGLLFVLAQKQGRKLALLKRQCKG